MQLEDVACDSPETSGIFSDDSQSQSSSQRYSVDYYMHQADVSRPRVWMLEGPIMREFCLKNEQNDYSVLQIVADRFSFPLSNCFRASVS